MMHVTPIVNGGPPSPLGGRRLEPGRDPVLGHRRVAQAVACLRTSGLLSEQQADTYSAELCRQPDAVLTQIRFVLEILTISDR